MSELKDYTTLHLKKIVESRNNNLFDGGCRLEAIRELIRIDELDRAIDALTPRSIVGKSTDGPIL